MDANNPQLLEQHVCCACAELPVTEEEDGCYFGPGLSAAMDSLVAQSKLSDELSKQGDYHSVYMSIELMCVTGLVSRHPHTTNTRALYYSGVLDTPAAAISLRAIDPERYAIVNEEDGDVIEEIEESKAFYEVYDGAVYMFQVLQWSCSLADGNVETCWLCNSFSMLPGSCASRCSTLCIDHVKAHRQNV